MFKLICDFDGTIAVTDVVAQVFEEFATPRWRVIEQDWIDGKISTQERLFSQVALVRAQRHELTRLFQCVEMDAAFPHFVTFCVERQCSIMVVSEGIDIAVRQILARHRLGDLLFVANRFEQQTINRWKVTFPYQSDTCWRGTGICQIVPMFRRTKPLVFIGGGRSDRCFVRQADLVLAKGSLIDYCAAHGIPHLPVYNFADVLVILHQLSAPSFFESPVYH